MYMCHRINKIRRENFCKHGSHGRRARSVVHFSISFAVLAKIDHELFVLFVFTKVPAKTKVRLRVLHHLKVIVFSFSFRGTNSLLVDAVLPWVFPRPQNWFQTLLNSRALEFWFKENFRVSRQTFDHICHLVGPNLERQNTRFREAIPLQLPSVLQLVYGD